MTEQKNTEKPRILLIEDNSEQMSKRLSALEKVLDDQDVCIDSWQPGQDGEDDYEAILQAKLKSRPTLVATDHALEEGGAHGFRSGSVITACRREAIPVGNYSRTPVLLEEPNLFLFRFDDDPDEAAAQIAEIYSGFLELGQKINDDSLSERKGWSRTLARLLGREDMAASFSLYSARNVGSFSTTIGHLEKTFSTDEAVRILEVYLIGHLLRNGILTFPGPIMDEFALCSYLACADDRAPELKKTFANARYLGPFGSTRFYFWQDDVDDLLEDMADELDAEGESDLSDDEFRREIVSSRFDPGTHDCTRCNGTRGGFRCPYTKRSVCDRKDCSAASSSWIPTGAHLSRVEREYYERHAPLLGL